MKSVTRYTKPINAFGAKRILVIGDLLLDIYLKGSSTRLCPEAPVPVVDVQERTVLPGGAANTASNLKALGASIVFCTVIGTDQEGDEAIFLLQKSGIGHTCIVRDASRTTITKSRVVSGAQVITRIDQGTETPVSQLTANRIGAHIEREYHDCDAIIISDYDKGVITAGLIDKLVELQKRHRKFIAVDSKRLSFFARLRPSYVKPNYNEAIKLLALPRKANERPAQLAEHADALYEALNAPLITVTLDSEGSVVIEDGKMVKVLPPPAVINPHVSGAGDTYLSAFVLSYLGSRSSKTSAIIATAAASIAIRKECTSTCSQLELKSYFNVHTKYVADLNDLRELCNGYHQAGKKIVFTNGCFDILHSGHVTYLHRAKELGDVLIVGLNTDDSIKRIKGKNRPINGLADRLKVLAGLSSVDHVIPFGDETEDTPVSLIREVRPHIFAKGGDYTKEKLPEADTVLACGGEIVFLDHVPDRSTTLIINKINGVSKNIEKAFSELPS